MKRPPRLHHRQQLPVPVHLYRRPKLRPVRKRQRRGVHINHPVILNRHLLARKQRHIPLHSVKRLPHHPQRHHHHRQMRHIAPVPRPVRHHQPREPHHRVVPCAPPPRDDAPRPLGHYARRHQGAQPETRHRVGLPDARRHQDNRRRQRRRPRYQQRPPQRLPVGPPPRQQRPHAHQQ